MTRSRLVYELAKETFLVEELRINLLLPSSESATKLLEERKKKREEIWQDFYATDAMLNRNWTKANQQLRHVVTRLAVHGYHHKLCKRTYFHNPDNECVYSLCDNKCDRYHITMSRKKDKISN
jgi:hypothetical protein